MVLVPDGDNVRVNAGEHLAAGGTCPAGLLSAALTLHGRSSVLRDGTGRLRGGIADSCGDHRIAMSAAVAACLCESPVTVQGMACVSKSYPHFWEDFDALKGGGL